MSSPAAVDVQHRPSTSHLSSHPDNGSSEKCEWGDCQLKFRSLPELVNHLSEDHIKWKRPTYTCEWRGCTRRGMAQQSRFALISHLRSHTGEKPYDCTHPECDKSFTRTDALVKHLRQQHGEPPGGGGGGGGGTGGHGTATSSSSPSQSLTGNASSHHNHYAGGNHHHGSSNNGNGHHEHQRHHHHPSTPHADEDPYRRVRRAHSTSIYRHSSSFDRERVSSQHLKRRRSTSIGSHNGHSATSQTKRAKTLSSSTSLTTKPSLLSHSHHHRGRQSSLDRQSYHRATSLQHRRDRRNSPSVSDTETDSDQGGSHGHHRRNASPGSSPRDVHTKYKNAKARYLYISRENELLAEEYEVLRRKLRRLRIEKNVLLEAMYEMSGGPDNDDLDSSNLDSDLGEIGNELDDDDMDHDALSPAPVAQPPPPAPVKGKRGGRRPGAGRKAGRKKELEMIQQQQALQQQQQPQQQQVLQQLQLQLQPQPQPQPQLQQQPQPPHLQLQQNSQQPQHLEMPQNIELSSEPAVSGKVVKVEEEMEAVEEMRSP